MPQGQQVALDEPAVSSDYDTAIAKALSEWKISDARFKDPLAFAAFRINQEHNPKPAMNAQGVADRVDAKGSIKKMLQELAGLDEQIAASQAALIWRVRNRRQD